MKKKSVMKYANSIKENNQQVVMFFLKYIIDCTELFFSDTKRNSELE